MIIEYFIFVGERKAGFVGEHFPSAEARQRLTDEEIVNYLTKKIKRDAVWYISLLKK